MQNKIYKRGIRKEYKIIEDLKAKGYDIVQRTAGSRSKIDIIAIKIKNKEILLIQSKRVLKEKMSFINEQLKSKLEAENKALNGCFNVEFKAL